MGTKVIEIARFQPRRSTLRLATLLCVVGLAVTGAVLPDTTASAAAPPRIAVGDVTIPEGNTGTTPARVIVRLSKPVTTNTIVRFSTADGTALAGSDYRKKSATVRIRAGKTSAAITVPVVGDVATEQAETARVTLTGAGGISITDSLGIVTIRDDESNAGVSIGDATTWEGDAGTGLAKLAVVLNAAVGTDTIVSYAMADGTASTPSDYRSRIGRIRIRAGRTSAAITPAYFGDTGFEPDEQLLIVLTGTGSSGIAISDRLGTVTLRNDEPVPLAPTSTTSTTSTTTTTTAPPTLGVPADLTVVAGPFPRYLTAEWAAPTSGLPVTGYDLEVTRGATTNVVANTTAPYAFGCGLAETTDTCIVRVRARNANGDGPWSAAVTASTWSAPAAPPNLTVLDGGGAVTWDAPPSDRPVTSYQVQKRADGSTSWTHVTTTTLTHAATTCGFCSVRVSAQSEVGFGLWSTVAIALPGSPTELTATRDASNHELVHVVWLPPADAGSHPVTSYEVFVNEFPTTPTSGPSADVFLRSTLTWQIQVYARNLVGRSLVAATVTLPPG